MQKKANFTVNKEFRGKYLLKIIFFGLNSCMSKSLAVV